LVLNGAGGSDLDIAAVERCAAAYPQYRWSALGVAGAPWVEDPWSALCSADVVISSAGQNSVADIATAGRPAIIVAEDRPFAEQHALAWALQRGGLAVVQHGWPGLSDWPGLIERARASADDRWQRWGTRDAATRAATAILRRASP
jgi:UDP-N-acetylglucosamine:LPS N-acetylglucosamine transferase